MNTTTKITALATIGDLINTIQTVMNHDTLDTVVIDAGGRLHTAPDYWTATYGRPAEEVIDVGAHQEATQILQKLEISVSEPVTAKKLAAEAIERGWVDNAIDELATKQAYSLRIPHPHEGYSRDTATEYVAVVYNTRFGTEIAVTSDLTYLNVLAVLAKPGEHVTRDELVERLYTARKNIKQQIKNLIRG